MYCNHYIIIKKKDLNSYILIKSMNLEEKLKKSEKIFKDLEKSEKFNTRYGSVPPRVYRELSYSMIELSDSLDYFEAPQYTNELYESELKRRLIGEAANIDEWLKGRLYDFETVIKLLGIPVEDIVALHPWLCFNKGKVEKALERLYDTSQLEDYELGLDHDIPSVRREVESFAATNIQRYHIAIGKFLQHLTNVGEFMRDIKVAPTIVPRSYFNLLTNTLAIGIPRICYQTREGILKLREKELIRIYGHEGMGHALNLLLTNNNNIPYFLMRSSSQNESTSESVAQFYEKQLLEDLKVHSDIQNKLGILHNFNSIYQESKDIEIIEEFTKKLGFYSFYVLADKSLGDYRDLSAIDKRKKMIDEVALMDRFSTNVIQSNYSNYDFEGNLNSHIIAELRYCARPVERSLELLNTMGITYEKDRNFIDSVFLKGFWTPIGFVDNVRLHAEKYLNDKK